jgi:hypothetical protein
MAALLAGTAGCASVYSSSQGSLDGLTYKSANGVPSEHVYIKTTGYYFFWTVPLASGDLRWDDEAKSIKGGTRLFCDMVGATELQNALLKIAETRNCDVIDVTFHDSDTSFAGVSTGGAIGAMFGSSLMGVSGVLVPRTPNATAQDGGAK